jgi:hypothetical protein
MARWAATTGTDSALNIRAGETPVGQQPKPGGAKPMARKLLRRAFLTLLQRSPKSFRDKFLQSQLNLQPLLSDTVFEIAQSHSDLDQAFQLLHDAYVREGFSKPHLSGRRITDYHALPSTTTLVAKRAAEVVATISVIRDGPFGLPSDTVVDLSGFRDQGLRLGEVSSLAIKPQFRGHSGELLFHLFKFMLHYSMYYFGLDRFIIVVNPNRISLYESILAFERLQPTIVESYAFANNAPGVCATLDLTQLEKTFQRIYGGRPHRKNVHRFFFGDYSLMEKQRFRFPERDYHAALDPVMSPAIMNHFFNECTDTFCRLDARKVKILQSIYSEQDYHPIWPSGRSPNWQNQRGHRRFDVVCTASLPAHPQKLTAINILDASRTGLRVRSSIPLQGEERPVFQIAVGRQRNARLQADMRWQRGATAGLEIVDADAGWHHFIDHMEQRMAQTAQGAPVHRASGPG